MKITRDVPKSITKSLIPPHRHMISEQYLTPWSGEVELVKSFCAKGDGATGYITVPNGAISGVAGSDWSIAFLLIYDDAADGFLVSTYDTSGATIRFYVSTPSSAIRLQIGTGGPTDVLPAHFLVSGSEYLGMLQYSNSTGKITSKIKDMATGTITDGTDYSVVGLTGMSGFVLGILGGPTGVSPSSSCIANLRIWFSSVSFENMQNLYYTTGINFGLMANGSLLDISGNDYHGTVHGTVDLYETQRFFHYNIMYGFDDYTDDATGLIHVYVPYVDGSPVVASITDYTKQTSNPAGIYHNGAETKVVPFTSSHDGTGWVVPADIKAIDTNEILHDAGTGYGKELSYADLAAIDEDYLFVDTTTALQYKNIMLYTEALTGVELVKADKFVGN